jgi:endonuclease/exonuclease/phosphatase (EEP) superfamily protein YafD
MKSPPFLLTACLVGLSLPLVTTHLAAYPAGMIVWLIDLASNWQWLFMLGLIYSCMIAMRKNIRWGIVLFALPLPWLTASQPAPSAGKGTPFPVKILSIATANVHLGNRSAKALGQWIDQVSPDVVVLNEVSPAYALELERIKGYPYRYLLPSDGPFGSGLLSRFPLSGIRVIPSENGSSHVEAQIIWGTTSVALTAIHPMPPISPGEHNTRNLQLAAVTAAAMSSGQPSIIVGDLNATPWSSAFSGIEDTGVRRATGLSPTWPSIGQGWLGIPIDHVLITPHWSVMEQQPGPNVGSDHLPVLVKIGLTSQ